jgi:hypothetical protein
MIEGCKAAKGEARRLSWASGEWRGKGIEGCHFGFRAKKTRESFFLQKRVFN